MTASHKAVPDKNSASTVGIGIVGIGFMGMIHYLAARKLRDAQVVALCSRDAKKLAGDWTAIQGNFGPRGTLMDLSAHSGYADVADLLADPQVDLVDLCVPNDEHARLAIRALEAGKHVLVEKPIALTAADADAMVAAAKASGKLLMVAHVLPFFPEFAFAAEAVRSGRYGALQAAHFTRVISRPDWSSGIADADRSGGARDRSAHPRYALHRSRLRGPPRRPFTRGRRGRSRRPPHDPVSLRRIEPRGLRGLGRPEPIGGVRSRMASSSTSSAQRSLSSLPTWRASRTWPRLCRSSWPTGPLNGPSLARATRSMPSPPSSGSP